MFFLSYEFGGLKKALRGVSVEAPKPHSGTFSGWSGSGSGGLPGSNSDFSVRNSDFRPVTLTFGPESESFHWKFAPQSFLGGSAVKPSWIQLSYECSYEKCSEIFHEIVEPLFSGWEKILQNSRQISCTIFLQKSLKDSPTSFCRSAGRIKILGGISRGRPGPKAFTPLLWAQVNKVFLLRGRAWPEGADVHNPRGFSEELYAGKLRADFWNFVL